MRVLCKVHSLYMKELQRTMDHTVYKRLYACDSVWKVISVNSV